MSDGASSLRRWCAGVFTGGCLALLALPSAAGAAGGLPAPSPDDPPAGFTASKPAARSDTVVGSVTRASAAAIPVPKPDAPTQPSATPTTSKSEPQAQPAPTRSTPKVAARARQAPVAVASSGSGSSGSAAPSQSTVAARAEPPSRPARPATRKQTPKPTAVVRTKLEPPIARSTPRDALRIGLPVGTLRVPRPADGVDALLLAAAALLLGVAAAGTLVLGVAARGIARHA
jgi:hypothetical protein